jgi:hypothetical protein
MAERQHSRALRPCLNCVCNIRAFYGENDIRGRVETLVKGGTNDPPQEERMIHHCYV